MSRTWIGAFEWPSMAPIFANKCRFNEVGIVRPTTTKNNGRIGQLMDGFTQHSAAIEWNFGVEKSWLVPIFFGNLFDFFLERTNTRVSVYGCCPACGQIERLNKRKKRGEQRERRGAGFMTRESGRVKRSRSSPHFFPRRSILPALFFLSQITRISTFRRGEIVLTRRPRTVRYADEQSRIFSDFSAIFFSKSSSDVSEIGADVPVHSFWRHFWWFFQMNGDGYRWASADCQKLANVSAFCT